MPVMTSDHQLTFAEYWACRYIMFRGAIIGTLIGALPGIGSTAAATPSYTTAREAAKDHSGFGKGDIRGLAAVESANSAVAGSNLIPLISWIPGSVTAALVLSAMLVHGIQPGPLIFEQQGRLVYGIFCAMLVANAINFAIGLVGWRLWARVAAAPNSIFARPFCFACRFVGRYGRYFWLGCSDWGNGAGRCHEASGFPRNHLHHHLLSWPPVRAQLWANANTDRGQSCKLDRVSSCHCPADVSLCLSFFVCHPTPLKNQHMWE